MKLSQIYNSVSKYCRNLSLIYDDKNNTITGQKEKFRFTVSKAEKSFEIVFFDGKYNYPFPLKDEEISDFLLDLAENKVSLDSLNYRIIQIKGWKKNLKRKRSTVKAVIFYIVSVAIALFALSGLIYCIQQLFDNTYGFISDIMLIPWLIGIFIISYSMIGYAKKQCRYGKNLLLYILGVFVVSCSFTLILGLWRDYPTDNRFGLFDYIGTSLIFLFFAVSGAGLIYLAYRSKKSDSIIVFRIPILPPKEEAQRLIDTIRQNLGGQAVRMILEPYTPTNLFSSKIGGVPYWDLTRPYPVSSVGNKMVMTAQFRLDELPQNEFLPNEGLLQIFADNDEKLSETKVIYHKKIDFSLKEKDVLNLGITDGMRYEEGFINFDFELENPIAVKFEAKPMLYDLGKIDEIMHSTASKLGIKLDETLLFSELDDSETFRENQNYILFRFNSGSPIIKSTSSDLKTYDVVLMCIYHNYYGFKFNIFANSENLKTLDFSDVCMKLE